MKALKSFVNQTGGGGGAAADEAWLLEVGLPALPAWCKRYKNELASAADRDFLANAPLAAALSKSGGSERDNKWRLTYVLNSMWERSVIQAVEQKLKGIAVVVSYEYDGLVVLPPGRQPATAEWERRVVDIACTVAKFVVKPYRTTAELLDHWAIARPSVSRDLLFAEEEKWLELEAEVRDAINRLRCGETVAGVIARALVRVPTMSGGKFFENYVAVSGSDRSLQIWGFAAGRRGGGWWRLLDTKEAEVKIGEVLPRALAQMLQCEVRHIPCVFIKDGFDAALFRKVCGLLFDASFVAKLDGDAAAGLVQFSCGRALRMSTLELLDGKREFYVSRSVGYEYPEDVFARLDAESGATIDATFASIRTFEAGVQGDVEKYPPALVFALQSLASKADFELLRHVHSCFSAETHGWPVTVFRGLKVLAAAISEAPVETFVNDEGVGGNGKGFLTALAESIMGDLAWQLKEAMLVQKPPGAESPSPALLELRGRRMLAAPEVESTMRMQSAWLKRLCDQTTIWHARELYAKREIAFKLRAIFCVSTNQPLKFTSLDGGVARRGINVSYPFVFKCDPKGETEKPLLDELKNPEYLAARRAGYLYLILKAVKAFFGAGHPGLRPLPAAVSAATETMLRAEFTEAVDEFLSDTTKEVRSGKEAMTRHELVARLNLDGRISALRISKSDLRDALAQVCEFVTIMGRRECVKHKARRQLLGWKQ
jgi:hypothetical protein